MDVGKGCIIADRWVVGGIETGIKDIDGNDIKTGDKVEIMGCTADYGYIGIEYVRAFWIYFGSDNGSVGWRLNKETVEKHKIRVIR